MGDGKGKGKEVEEPVPTGTRKKAPSGHMQESGESVTAP